MRLFVSIFLICATAFCVDGYSQSRLQRSYNKNDISTLHRIAGVCGCQDCDGILEHNNPVDEEDEFTGFFLGPRWSATVLSGGGLTQGTPTMVTWSIVPDGTDANGGNGFVPSNMIAFLDNLFNEANAGTADLTNRFWWARMQQALDRWGELSGVEYVYEPNDNGVPTFGGGGIQGVRGDVRIGGFNIDGPGGTLAFNALPDNGDMAIDTSDSGTFGAPGANFRLFRNVITHEQGHGLGIFHLESNNAAFLMEPFISGAFDGPQLDDIRAVHRQYGDVFEKSNNFQGNNSIANATPLGTINIGNSIIRGVDGATGTGVSLFDDDFLSVDDNSDQDFFEFSVPEIAFGNITLTPVGASYNQSQEGGGGATPFNPTNSSNLTLALFDSNGSLITLVNETTNGSAEVIEDEILLPGTYFVRATGSANTIQLYTLEIELAEFTPPNSTPPSNAIVSQGQVSSGTVDDMAASDDVYFELVPTFPDDPENAEISVLMTAPIPSLVPDTLSVSIESFSNSVNIERTVSIFNVITNQFEVLDSSNVNLVEDTQIFVPASSPPFYVAPANGNVLIDIRYEVIGPTLIFPWSIRIDELLVNTSG